MTQKRRILSAETLMNNGVKNSAGEDLGSIKSIMLDLEHGRIAYAVLSYGGLLGMGGTLYAIPWSAMKLDISDHKFILDTPKEKLKQASGFDNDDWPDFADPSFHKETYHYYGQTPYWP
jgi:sporulation protein YlmC with PRC-barrel domain